MSAYEKALHALAEDLACGDPWELHLEAAERIRVFLAALPPSIVVDGRVVEAYAVLGVMNRERKLEVSMMELLDAAREVTKGGQQ